MRFKINQLIGVFKRNLKALFRLPLHPAEQPIRLFFGLTMLGPMLLTRSEVASRVVVWGLAPGL